MGRSRLAAFAFLVLMLAPHRGNAAQHLFEIKEVFSNGDGSIQYIELFTTFAGQTQMTGHTLVINDGANRTFTFPTNLPVDTANKHVLIATAGFKNLSGAPTPDYTLPCGTFFNPAAGTITITFDGTSDVESFQGSALPKDGINSLSDSALSASGNASFASGMNSPTNINGATGPITLTTAQATGPVDACIDNKFCNGDESACAAGCGAGVAPCAQQCNEGNDTCVECLNVTHCNDNNPCTDDACNGAGACEHVAHVGSCDDGLFCNGADTCSGTTCTHAGDPCAGINCNEGPDTCANCTGASDCEDGQPCTVDTCNTGVCNRATAADGAQCDSDATFCNGVGICTEGICGPIAAPCDAMTETCEESNDSCAPIDIPTPDAPGPDNPKDDDGGGCCQANTSPATFIGPGLVLLLGLAFGRRRRRR